MTLVESPPARVVRRVGPPWQVLGLWLLALAGFAAVLWVAVDEGLRRFTVAEMQRAGELLARGDVVRAQVWLDSGAVGPFIPWSAVTGFAVVGATALALAWAGRRRWAFALPVVVALLTVGPATDWFDTVAQPLVPRPFGEAGADIDVWTALVAFGAHASPVRAWPYLLGSAVQLALLWLPLLAVRRPTATTSSWRWVRASAPVVVVGLLVTYVASDSWSTTGQAMPALLATGAIATAAAILGGNGDRRLLVPAAALLPGLAAAAVFPLTEHRVYYPWTNPPAAVWVALTLLTVAWLLVRERLVGTIRRAAAPAR